MSLGYFIVFQDKQDAKQIHFQVASAADTPPPEDQLALKGDIERTLTSIQILYAVDQAAFEQNFRALLALAQCGLVGPNAQPEIARRALVALREELLLREAGRVKNRYLRELGKYCLVMWIPAVIVGTVAYTNNNVELLCFGLCWLGAMIGVWLSFGYRKSAMHFENLTLLEEDRLEPPFRLLAVGFLTMFLCLIFYRQGVVIEVGSLSTKDVGTEGVVSFLVGGMCGFSEQALPSQFARHASGLFK